MCLDSLNLNFVDNQQNLEGNDLDGPTSIAG